MEDLNAIASDCLVISCCCQCLILQLLIIILLKLPHKLIRKTVSYAKKLRNRRRGGEKIVHSRRSSPFGGLSSNDHHECHKSESCMDEVEKVLEEFCLRGEFGFGRFWDGSEEEVSCGGGGSFKFPTCLRNDDDHHHHRELDYDVVSYHLIRMFGTCNGTDHDQSLIL